jgi:hypothetical protein
MNETPPIKQVLADSLSTAVVMTIFSSTLLWLNLAAPLVSDPTATVAND